MGTELTETDRVEAAALWRRWQGLASENPAGEPDFMALAALAEHGAVDEDGGAVDDWLRAAPEGLQDIAAARAVAAQAAAETAPGEAESGMMARAMALVADPASGVVPLRRPAQRRVAGWRGAVAWGGLAASLAATSLVGFALGNNAWSTLAGDQQTSAYQELFDPPSGIFSGIGDDEGI
jgi:hypothetical protein